MLFKQDWIKKIMYVMYNALNKYLDVKYEKNNVNKKNIRKIKR